MYSYSKTRGLFGGVSLEGSVIVERQDANHNAYKSPVTAKLLLGGMVDSPPFAASLTSTLDSCTGMPRYKKWVDDAPSPFLDDDYTFGRSESSGNVTNTSKSRSFLKKKKPEQDTFPPASWGSRTDTGAYFSDDALDSGSSPRFDTTFETEYRADYGSSGPPLGGDSRHNRSFSTFSPVTSVESLYGIQLPQTPVSRVETSRSGLPIPDEGMPRAIALYTFQAVEPGDLSFLKGEVITITQKSDKTDDWWTGKLGDRQGIFPANFVEVV